MHAGACEVSSHASGWPSFVPSAYFTCTRDLPALNLQIVAACSSLVCEYFHVMPSKLFESRALHEKARPVIC